MTIRAAHTLGLAALVLALAFNPACAQDYPNQLIRVISAFPPGSGADIVVRFFAERLKPLVNNQTVIVESKVGAGGMVSVEYIAKAKPDGYTVLVHSGVSAANLMYLVKNPPIDAAKDIQMAAMINRQPFMIAVRADKPWKNLAELTSYLKDQKEKATYGQSATIAKVGGELYKQIAGLSTTEVGYRNSPEILNDIAGGSLDFAVLDPLTSLAQARQGRIRILAVTTAERTQGSFRSADDARRRRARNQSRRMVRRDGAFGDAAPHRRQAQRMVQRDRRNGRGPRLPGEFRRRPVDRVRRRGAEILSERSHRVEGIRPAREDRAAIDFLRLPPHPHKHAHAVARIEQPRRAVGAVDDADA